MAEFRIYANENSDTQGRVPVALTPKDFLGIVIRDGKVEATVQAEIYNDIDHPTARRSLNRDLEGNPPIGTPIFALEGDVERAVIINPHNNEELFELSGDTIRQDRGQLQTALARVKESLTQKINDVIEKGDQDALGAYGFDNAEIALLTGKQKEKELDDEERRRLEELNRQHAPEQNIPEDGEVEKVSDARRAARNAEIEKGGLTPTFLIDAKLEAQYLQAQGILFSADRDGDRMLEKGEMLSEGKIRELKAVLDTGGDLTREQIEAAVNVREGLQIEDVEDFTTTLNNIARPKGPQEHSH